MQQQKPLEGAQLVIMTIALSLATFMQVLDSTIANVAIPTIAGNLGSSLSQGTWVITSFGVANAISIPLTGWLAKRVGEVKLFLWSTIAFAIASWACGVSSSLNMLIFFRVIQGIVAGPLIPLSQSLLLNNYPPAKRSIAPYENPLPSIRDKITVLVFSYNLLFHICQLTFLIILRTHFKKCA